MEQKQPKLEVRNKQLIEESGLTFKDLNNNGKIDPYEDWRLSPEERAKNLVSLMNIDEKIGMMLINTRRMGLYQEDKSKTSHDGVLDEAIVEREKVSLPPVKYMERPIQSRIDIYVISFYEIILAQQKQQNGLIR